MANGGTRLRQDDLIDQKWCTRATLFQGRDQSTKDLDPIAVIVIMKSLT
jgi:hypothetical protein